MEMNVPISADGDDGYRASVLGVTGGLPWSSMPEFYSSQDSAAGGKPPAPPRTRKTSKVILDILGVSCQVEPTTAAEVAPLNQLAEDHGPEAAVAAKALAEGIVTSPVPPPPSAISS